MTLYAEQKWRPLIIACFLVFGMIMGCAGAQKSKTPQITLIIESNAETNNGQSFYLVVRNVDQKLFLTESYQEVAAALFSDPPLQNMIAAVPIVPGVTQELRVRKAEENSIAVYCLFSEPSDQWKLSLPQPLYPRYTITLRENRILEAEHIVHRKKGILQRWFGSDEPRKKQDE